MMPSFAFCTVPFIVQRSSFLASSDAAVPLQRPGFRGSRLAPRLLWLARMKTMFDGIDEFSRL
jgi:hypothetical protein